MAYYDANQPVAGAQCHGCGTPLSGQPNCPGCGIAVSYDQQGPFQQWGAAQQQGAYYANQGQYPPQAPPPPAAQPYPPIGHGYNPEGYYQQGYAGGGGQPPQPPQKSILPWAIAAVLVTLIAAVVAVVLLSGSGDDSSDNNAASTTPAAAAADGAAPASGPAYEQKVKEIFAPVDEANANLSRELKGLPQTGGAAPARAAVQRAMDATSTARGALGATPVPYESQSLQGNVKDILDSEQEYLDELDKFLTRPSETGARNLPVLELGLLTDLQIAGGPFSGTTGNVDGAEEAAAWSERTAAAAARKRRRMEARRREPSRTPAPAPAPRGTDCGAGIHAGPNTSCAFARNVFQAWLEAPGLTATVEVYSPATGETYTMHCAPAGSGTTCSGGNGASVSF